MGEPAPWSVQLRTEQINGLDRIAQEFADGKRIIALRWAVNMLVNHFNRHSTIPETAKALAADRGHLILEEPPAKSGSKLLAGKGKKNK